MAKNEVMLNVGKMLVGHGQTIKALGIDMSSITNMGMVKTKRLLNEEKERLIEEQTNLKKELEGIETKLGNLLKKEKRKHKVRLFKLYSKFAKSVGVTKPTVDVTVMVEDDRLNVSCGFSSEDQYHCVRGSTLFDMPTAVAVVCKEEDKVRKELGDIELRLLETMSKLQDTADLRDKANAAITHATLSSTPEGRSILEGLGLKEL